MFIITLPLNTPVRSRPPTRTRRLDVIPGRNRVPLPDGLVGPVKSLDEGDSYYVRLYMVCETVLAF